MTFFSSANTNSVKISKLFQHFQWLENTSSISKIQIHDCVIFMAFLYFIK